MKSTSINAKNAPLIYCFKYMICASPINMQAVRRICFLEEPSGLMVVPINSPIFHIIYVSHMQSMCDIIHYYFFVAAESASDKAVLTSAASPFQILA